MGRSLEEMQHWIAESQHQITTKQVAQQQARAHVATVMTELLIDPKWELYARHINTLYEQAKAQHEHLDAILLDKVLKLEDYTQTKVDQQRWAATARAFKTSLDLIHKLIEDGKLPEA
jgi:hypothetical protein